MKTALILIDIQNDYFPGGAMELAGSDAAGRRAAEVLGTFRVKGLPVVHIRHESVRPGATFFIPGTTGADIHPCVLPRDDEAVVLKNFPNSFRGTDLLDRLRSLDAGRLVFAGMMTHMCVDATVRAAFDHGFSCSVVHDACATRDLDFNGITVPAPAVHASFLAALGAVYAAVVPAAALRSELEGAG